MTTWAILLSGDAQALNMHLQWLRIFGNCRALRHDLLSSERQVGDYFATPSTAAASWTVEHSYLARLIQRNSYLWGRINTQLMQFTSFYVNLPYGADLNASRVFEEKQQHTVQVPSVSV